MYTVYSRPGSGGFIAEAIRIVILTMEWTGGAQGTSVPKVLTPAVAWTALALVVYWFWRQSRSRYGRALEAIREDETAALAAEVRGALAASHADELRSWSGQEATA